MGNQVALGRYVIPIRPDLDVNVGEV